jgi:hypothetical protein
MIKLKNILTEEKRKLSESSSKDIYFRSVTDAVNFARQATEKRGFEIDEDDWWTSVALGGKYGRLRPGIGKTHTVHVGLLKNGKPQRKQLTISLYGMPSGNYELTHYIG